MHHHVAFEDDGDERASGDFWRAPPWASSRAEACSTARLTSEFIAPFAKPALHSISSAGTSGGAAMAAAFAQDLDPLAIDAGVHRMFIDGRALSWMIFPKYGLLDHTHFDAHLEREYGNIRIEDLWKPGLRQFLLISRTTKPRSIAQVTCGRPSARARRYPACCRRSTDDGRMLVDRPVILVCADRDDALPEARAECRLEASKLAKGRNSPSTTNFPRTRRPDLANTQSAFEPNSAVGAFGCHRARSQLDGQPRPLRALSRTRRLAACTADTSRNGRARLAPPH